MASLDSDLAFQAEKGADYGLTRLLETWEKDLATLFLFLGFRECRPIAKSVMPTIRAVINQRLTDLGEK